MPHLSDIISVKHGCIQSESIGNDYYCCYCWILLYWVDRDQWVSEWIKQIIVSRKKYALLVSTRWMMGLCQHCLCISLCMQRDGDKGLNVSQLQELYFTWCALEMQYLNLKTKARLLRGAFACKHQVVVWNTVLPEHFEALRTGRIDWDGHIFCWKCEAANFLWLYIWKTWANLSWKATG